MRRTVAAAMSLVLVWAFLPAELHGAAGGRGGMGRGGFGPGGGVGRGGVPGGIGRGGMPGGPGRGGGDEYPCDWTESTGEPAKKLDSNREFLYLYLYREPEKEKEDGAQAGRRDPRRAPEPRLKGNFYSSKEMQQISRERLVFVKTPVPKKISDELKATLLRLKIKKLPTAVITDRFWNPLYVHATTENPALLLKQIERAKVQAVKIEAAIRERYEKAVELCKERDYLKAASELVKARAYGFVGIPVMEETEKLFKRIDDYMEKRFKAIQKAEMAGDARKELLRRLRAEVHKELPVYKSILEAYKKL